MANIVERILVVLGLKNDEFSQGAKNAKKESYDLAQELRGATSASGLLEGAMAAAGVAGIAVLAAEAEKAAYDLAVLGAQNERIAASFQSLAIAAGQSGDEIMAAMMRAADGTVDDEDLMRAANAALVRDLQITAEQWGQLVEIARDRARAMGTDTVTALNQMVEAIGSGYGRSLKGLGFTDITQGLIGYADGLGVASSEMSTAAAQQQLLNTVLEQGQAKIAAQGGLTRDAVDDIDAAKIAWGNLKDELAEQVAPVVVPIVEYVTRVITEKKTGEADYQRDVYGDLSRILPEAMEATLHFGDVWLETADDLAEGGEVIEDVTGKVAAWEAGFRRAGAGVETAAKRVSAVLLEMRQNLTLDDIGAGLTNALGQAQSTLAGLAGTVSYSVVEGLYAEAEAQLAELYSKASTMTDLEVAYQEEAILGGLNKTVQGHKDAAKTSAKSWEDAFSDLKSTVASALQPTTVSAMDFLPGRTDAWDENARRLDAIAARGGAELIAHPDWASILMIPPDVLAAGDEALKAWASQTSSDVRNLFRPDLLSGSLDEMVETVRAYVVDQENREQTIDDVTAAYQAKYGGSAADAKKMAKMLMGDTSAVGETVADDLAAGMKKSMGQGSLTATLVATWRTDVDANKKDLQDAGGRIWDVLFGGIRQAVKDQDPSLIQVIAEKVAPAVARILQYNWM